MGTSRPQPESLAPYADLLRFGFFNATTWMIGLGTPLVLLAGQLGASSLEVGIIYAFVFLLLPLQILATSTLPRFGYKRQLMAAWGARGLFLLFPLWLAFLAPEEPARWMVYLLIGSTFCFALFRALGSCAVMPLVYAILPERIRGRYFSTDQAVTGISGILTLVLCSLLFRFLPIYDAFFWQYTYAVVGVFLTLYYLGKVKDPPPPEETSLREITTETPRVCISPSPFRQYLLFMLTSAAVGTAFVPLQAYYLKVEANLGIDRILFYTAIQYMGAILGTLIIRNRIDRVGVKPVFRFALLTGACIATYWFFLITGTEWLLGFLPLAYFAFGIQSSQWITAHLKYMPRVCDDRKQALHVSVHSSVIGIIGGLAPIFWGFMVKLPSSNPGVRLDLFAVYFLCLLAVHLTLFFYTGKLTSQYRERPPLLAGGTLLRPMRFMGTLINAIPSKPHPARKNGSRE
jgi:MFS family permease